MITALLIGCLEGDTGFETGDLEAGRYKLGEGKSGDGGSGFANGFRLPSHLEWEFAARLIGREAPQEGSLKYDAIPASGYYFTPADYASGALEPTSNASATQLVAWYKDNSYNRTHDVGKKTSNQLGIYDMSGNIAEMCFNQNREQNPPVRGGDYYTSLHEINLAHYTVSSIINPGNKYRGFRVVRNH